LPSSNAGTVFIDVRLGSAHKLALDSTGTVWSWGVNSFGQVLADGTVSDRLQSDPLPLNIAASHPWAVDSSRQKIVQICASGNISMVLTESRQVFAFGGLQAQNKRIVFAKPVPVVMDGLCLTDGSGNTNQTCAVACQLSCAADHLAVVSNEGELFVWDVNSLFKFPPELSHGANHSFASPVQTSDDDSSVILTELTAQKQNVREVCDIASGAWSDFILNQDNVLWKRSRNIDQPLEEVVEFANKSVIMVSN
jgi:alpha-tubulin suppressor-like RCC1 family protein